MAKFGVKAIAAAAVALFLATGFGSAGAASSRFELANGLTATVYPPDDLAATLTTYAGAPALELEDGRFLPVITEISDPAIYNKGDGTFHPFSVEMVGLVLASVEHPRLRLDVRVYLLPYPRRNVLVSSTSGNEIFLSPHVLDIEPTVSAYIIAHELGHAFHNRFMPDGSLRWTEFRRLRGIDDEARFYDAAPHAFRPREILAEDFRVLFGGAEAFFDGRVENTEITPPVEVAGLESFFLRASSVVQARDSRIAATSYPNPFNPETEIRISIPAEMAQGGERVSVNVYSVTGALVRSLHEGRASGDLSVRWDGRDESGNRVASSTYYAAVQVGDERQTIKLVLLK